MKRVFIFLMLAALFAPLAMHAQRAVVKQKDVDLFSMPTISLSELDSKGGDRATNTLMNESFENMSIATSYSANGWFAYNAGNGNNWTLISSNANSGSKSVQYSTSSYAADCYLVSAPFTVSANASSLSVSLYELVDRGLLSTFSQTFEVFFVKASDVTTAASVASATHYDAIPSASYSNTSYDQQNGFCMSSALAGQSVRVVVHCTSSSTNWLIGTRHLYVDDIVVTENSHDTPCGVVSLPHFNGFESVAQYGCWTMIGSDMTLSTSNAYAGSTTCLRINGLDNDQDQFLISPEFDGESAMEMSFYYRIANQNRDQFFYVGWGPDLSHLSWNPIEIASNTTYQEYTEVFPKGTKYVIIGVYGRSSTSTEDSYMLIDNIYFTGGCIKPRDVEANNITPNTADISWGVYSDNGYNVRYRPVTRTPNGNPVTRFSDDFETGSINSTKWGTQNQKYTSTSTDWGVRNIGGITGYNNSSYYASSRSYDGSEDRSVKNWLFTNSAMTLGNAVEFYMKENHPSWLDHIEVLVSKDDLTFVSIGSPTVSSAEWEKVFIDLGKYDGQTGYVAILHEDSINDFVAIDDFSVLKYNYNYEWGDWVTTYEPKNNYVKLDELDYETMYEVQVQSACGSEWSTSIYFTTLSGCTAPTDLTADDITAFSATLGWSEYQSSYDVRYRGQVYFEDFNRGLPSDWTTINADTDSYGWQVWSHGFDGSPSVASASYINSVGALTPDNWLISPQLDLGGFFEVWLKGQDDNEFEEYYTIYLSTTGNAISDFTTTLASGYTTNIFQRVTANLNDYAGQQGYIAIRHHDCTDQYWLVVDNFGIYKTDWIAATPNQATVAVSGLLFETEYVWQVSGEDCDNWSAPAYFTTLKRYTKDITGYSSNSNLNYYLIASPIGEVEPTKVYVCPLHQLDQLSLENNMVTGNYDLYYFDQSHVLEWINYDNNTSGEGNPSSNPGFKLVAGKGYLYANKYDVTLVFCGSAYTGSGQVTLSKTAEAPGLQFPDWNLVGNPFAENAWLEGNRSHYTMDANGNLTAVTSDAINPMEGIFVVANSNEEKITFTTTQPQKNSKFVLNLSHGQQFVDRAIVRFDGGDQLPKLQLFGERTKVYFPVEGQDYAVVTCEEMGAMPVNFKAEENGAYTLSFSGENVGFAYLHLIDNMTGADVDLLQTPSYRFEAKTTDYASRFKLVFATGDNSNSDNFAFFSNGSFVINNEGAATLQVIDVTGRILSSESINGCANVNVNAAAGVYMLRLVNGDNVKVQKVVVR